MDDYLELSSIDKTYAGPVHALQDVSLSVRKGSVHAIIGENGAGKSTLARILGGLVGFDSGTIRFKGRDYRPESPEDASRQGIGMVHQHFMLFPSLTVAENIVLGKEPTRRAQLDTARAQREVREISEFYGMPVDPGRRIADLSVGEQQRVEILKALYQDVELVIFDEPTAVLTPQEVEKLFKGIRRLIAEDYTVILIAHKLEEVLAIADDITVLRRGRLVGSQPAAGATREELVRLMVGPADGPEERIGYGEAGAELLSLKGLSLAGGGSRPALADISLTLARGEIVGIAGMEGNGQVELEQVLGGLLTPAAGRVTLEGEEITRLTPLERRRSGIVYIPSDRMSWGCSPRASVFENSISQCYRSFSRAGFLRRRPMREWVGQMFREFDVRVPGLFAPVASLSGGNIQKLILGRELTTVPSGENGVPVRPRLLVVSMPTRGVDIRGVAFIHNLLRSYRDAGCGILLISSDLDEIVALSDRIAVLFEGAIAATLPGRGETDKEDLGRYMLGGEGKAA